jgi:hypothetical protein
MPDFQLGYLGFEVSDLEGWHFEGPDRQSSK